MLSTIVRVAVPADFTNIRSLVFGAHMRALLPHDVTSRLERIFPSLANADAFAAPANHFWVAVDEGADDAVLGAISIISGEGGPDAAELNAFYVHDAHQRRGHGAKLFDAALAFCRASGVRRVSLTSNKGHYDAAIAFYERRGFTRTAEFAVAPGIVLVEMALELR